MAQDVEIGKRFATVLITGLPAQANPLLEVLGSNLLRHVADRHEFSFFAFEGARQQMGDEIFAFPADWRTMQFTEAIALPGGGIFVPRSLMARRPNDELAAILAHAIGHVVLRHPTQMATALQLIDTGSMPNLMENPVSSLARAARGLELAADRYAVGLLKDSGVDPEALARYVKKLPEGAMIPSGTAMHPTAENRMKAIVQAIAQLP
jgi:predicted Zn-dependent protease